MPRREFGCHHEGLNRARWDARDRRAGCCITCSRCCGQWREAHCHRRHHRAELGGKIRARGIDRDPVRLSRGRFVKIRGPRWLCLAAILPDPFAERR